MNKHFLFIGPCPPCPVMVKTSCYCSKVNQTRRCSHREFSCNGICSKKLKCKLHTCQDICHSLDCKPCDKVSLRKCQCGSKKEERACEDIEWQCEKVSS